MPTTHRQIKLKILMEEAHTSLTQPTRGGRHKVFLELPNSIEFDEAIKQQANVSERRLGISSEDSKAVATMETFSTLKNFSPTVKQQTMLVRMLLDEYPAKKRDVVNVLSRIGEIEHLQMIYRASGAAMKHIRQVSTIADCYLFPVLRAVHWAASDKMEQLLPNRIAASPKANSHLYFSRPAQLGGRDVGELVMSHAGLTEHGHGADADTNNVYLSEQEAWSWKISISSDGKLYALNNYLPLDTLGANEHAANKNQGPLFKINGNDLDSYGYVMSTQGHIFAGEQTATVGPERVDIGIKTHRKPVFHSSYLGGNDIRCGGRIFVQQGVLKAIDNGSGHYQPNTNNFRSAILDLKRQGVDLSSTYVCDLSDEGLLQQGIDDRMKILPPYPTLPAPWQTVEQFLEQDVNITVPTAQLRLYPKLRTVVDSYRRRSRGLFSRPSKETLTALAVLQSLDLSRKAYFAACCFYAFYKSDRDENNNALKNYADYVARKHFVRLAPLEQVTKPNGQLKSGFRRKLQSILSGPPPNFR